MHPAGGAPPTMNLQDQGRDSALAARLARELEGEVLFDRFSRGRYSTDASIYQIEPIGVVIPRTQTDVERALQIAAAAGVPVLPRGAGTSQNGQTVGAALVIDTSKHLNRILALDVKAHSVWVEPGVVLDQLNQSLKPHGLFFPVDVSTAAQATIGGMTGNNSCGSRSIRYGNMVHNVRAIDALLADGTSARFGLIEPGPGKLSGPARYVDLVQRMCALSEREAEEIARRFPRLLRRVGGYNLDMLPPGGGNMASLLVGSEGTLAFFQRIQLDLQPLPRHRALAVCHFPSFYQAMKATQHLVKLAPTAVELVDRTMIELARDNPMFRDTLQQFVRGEPEALLLTEFTGENPHAPLQKLNDLEDLMAELGFPESVVKATDRTFQSSIWEVRKAGLNIMMSMKGDAKPVSFIEDCAVRLEDLAEYTDRLTRLFRKYGTTGTWYAHASVGCLHVRPILNLKDPAGASTMRAIAEEAFAIVREYEGSHSGEHGDGISRSEFHEAMFGARLVQAFAEIKDSFDPKHLLNPGKIVRPLRMDERTLFRYKPDYRPALLDTVLDWKEWGGFHAAVEMCNNNGACRKNDAAVMCPSYRATRDEQHLTRGRANTLRLALSGQLGRDAFVSEAMAATMELCVSCKGCRGECPTGVDMAKMKIEFLYHFHRRHGIAFRDKLIAFLPRYAPWAARAPGLLNLRNRVPAAANLSERWLGLSARRPWPTWRADLFSAPPHSGSGRDVVLLDDTFTHYFEPENGRAALEVLHAAGCRVHCPRPADGGRPLCCGRTFLAAGLVDQARIEARRLIETLRPFAEQRVPIIGLEPACLLTLRDEFLSILPGEETGMIANRALLLEEFLARGAGADELKGKLEALPIKRVLVHGHCHQKAFGAMPAVIQTLKLVPGLEVETIESSCCGMAGAFGYQARHFDVSMKMAELSLLPQVRAAPEDTLLVADGTSCRQQIRDGAGREAWHAARVLRSALTHSPTFSRSRNER
jgi:FAD/FMN-containing dehydrogenase/Fe-S oxidoreductase